MIRKEIAFIGAGPATIGAVLKLIDSGCQDNIWIFERGNELENRSPKEVLSGFAGAGCFSDLKLTSSLTVGGLIPKLTQEKLDKYSDEILEYFNRFSPDKLDWDVTTSYDTSGTELIFDTHKTLHVGTDRGQAIFKRIEDYINDEIRVQLITKCEVKDIDLLDNGMFKLYCKYYNKDVDFDFDKVIVATGQKCDLPNKLIEKFNLKTVPRAAQLGVRVVDEMNKQYEDIIKANYDFKFVKSYNIDGVDIRIRTFCCNSGNAHVCEEKAQEGFSCFNGHAYKTPDPNNHSVNYGIICEILGVDELSTRDKQLKLIKAVNHVGGWKEDNFDIEGKIVPRRKLLDGFNQLKGIYPQPVITAMEDFVQELNKLVDLSKAKYLYPEVKLNDGKKIETPNWESSQKNLYFIGDCNCTRGIIKSFLSGLQIAEVLLNG